MATGVLGVPGAPAARRVEGEPCHVLGVVTTRPPRMAALTVPVPAAIALPVTLRVVQVSGVPLEYRIKKLPANRSMISWVKVTTLRACVCMRVCVREYVRVHATACVCINFYYVFFFLLPPYLLLLWSKRRHCSQDMMCETEVTAKQSLFGV